MRTAAVALLIATAFAAPLQSQAPKGKLPQDRILAWELESYGDASLKEVIEKARPKFFMPDQTRIDFGAQTEWRVLVYIGMRSLGDTSILHTYKASEVKEIRHYRPNEAGTRFGSDNASVILLTPKEVKRKG